MRDRINQDLGEQWRDATKKDKKESMLKKIKEDEEFFLEVVKALKESSFKNYDIEIDAKGLYRWLEDSKQFINLGSLQVQNNCDDTLEAISFQAELIVNHFQNLIENKGLWRMFWTKINSKDVHVNEIYSQMFFMLFAILG